MADTGAPWNIPYVEPSDLVRNYPVAAEDLADAIAAGLTAAVSPGIGSNVVSAAKTDTFVTSSATFTTVTGLSVAITPSSATSKVLVIAQITHSLANDAGYGAFKVTRGGTNVYVGDAAGTRIQAVFGGFAFGTLEFMSLSGAVVFLDSPATAASVTYQVEVRTSGGGSVEINRTESDANSLSNPRGASSITAIEVAA